MGCRNCGTRLVERSEITRFEYSEVLVCDGREQVMNFKARNRVVLQSWAIDPRAHLVWNKEQITFKGPLGAEIAVRFAIGE